MHGDTNQWISRTSEYICFLFQKRVNIHFSAFPLYSTNFHDINEVYTPGLF